MPGTQNNKKGQLFKTPTTGKSRLAHKRSFEETKEYPI